MIRSWLRLGFAGTVLSALAALTACGSERGASGGGGTGGGGFTIETSGSGGSLAGEASASAGAGGERCRRDVSLTAVTIGAPAPFDLIIVADHSQSLAWSRD